MAKKEITNQFNIQAPGGKATPAPPIGPALGANGVNPGQFITKFNAMSAHLNGQIVGVLVTVYKDRTFDIALQSAARFAGVLGRVEKDRPSDIERKSAPPAELLKAAVKAEKGSGEPNKNKI